MVSAFKEWFGDIFAALLGDVLFAKYFGGGNKDATKAGAAAGAAASAVATVATDNRDYLTRARRAYLVVMAKLTLSRPSEARWVRASDKAEPAILELVAAEIRSLETSRSTRGNAATAGVVTRDEVEAMMAEILETIPTTKSGFDEWEDDLTKDASGATVAARKIADELKKKKHDFEKGVEKHFDFIKKYKLWLIPVVLLVLLAATIILIGVQL